MLSGWMSLWRKKGGGELIFVHKKEAKGEVSDSFCYASYMEYFL